MLQLEQALAHILDAIPAPLPEIVPLEEACGRILLEKALAPLDLPPFDNSAMDGYALRAADVATASADSPVRLRIVERLAAGSYPAEAIAPGTCSRIFTGSHMPVHADAVVMQEDTMQDGQTKDAVWIRGPVQPGENVRRRGEDVPRGSLLFDRGQRIGASHLMLLGAVGANRLAVGIAPGVGLLATGSELQAPGSELPPGAIYESNRLGLHQLLKAAGARCRLYPLVPDDESATRQALAQALRENNLVVTCGGVSVGDMDFVKPAFEAEGGTLEFWRVNMKPGRPFVFGRCGAKMLFGLPGNPLSAMVTCLLLVRPAVLKWQGASDPELSVRLGTLAQPIVNDGLRRHFMRVYLGPTAEVRLAGLQASHGLGALRTANGLLDVPGGTTWEAGRVVRVLGWD